MPSSRFLGRILQNFITDSLKKRITFSGDNFWNSLQRYAHHEQKLRIPGLGSSYFHIWINQPNQQIISFFGAYVPTFWAFIASDNREAFHPWISISWWSSTWTAACIATSPAHPCVGSIACSSARLWVTPPTSKGDYIYREWLENHKGSFTGWFELTLMSHFQVDYGWFSIYLFKVMFKRKICTIYFPGGKSWEWQSVLPWQLPFYGNILPHRRCVKQQNPLTRNPTQEIPLYNNDLQNTDCFSQTHIIPQSRNIQASRGTNLTYPTQTGNFAGNFPSTKSQAVHRPQIQQPFLEVQCSWSYFGYGHWVFRK